MSSAIQLDKSLDGWDLPVAAYNILKREGLYDIDKLTQMSEREISELRGFSTRPHDLELLIRKINQQGYRLTSYIEFKPVNIPGIKQGYQASRNGGIVSPKGKDLKADVTKGKARISVQLEDGRFTSYHLAIPVLSAFMGYEPDYQPMFLDGDTTNCEIDNLEWTAYPTKKPNYRVVATSRRTHPRPIEVPTPTGGKVETYRMYVSDDVTASVSDDGTGSIKVGSTTVSLTNRQLKSLVLVAGRIGEVNALMGIG